MIVIATTVNDVHAAVVDVALRALDVPCVRWISSDFPSGQEIAVKVSDSLEIHFSCDNNPEYCLPLFDEHTVVWNRRFAGEAVPPEELHPADAAVSARESLSFIDGFASLLNTANHRINDLYSAKRAESKVYQLLQAKSVGLSIPQTLFSNNPQLIRSFINHLLPNATLAKPFRPAVWRGSEVDWVSHSAIVLTSDLPADALLAACPMIYQAYIEKAYEVRVTCFDNHLVAARLNSQDNKRSRVDWRTVSPSKLNIEPLELPEYIRVRCILLLRALGLRFGCIDMICTPEGEWVFLEINQMGQFLWIQEANPEICLLEAFVNMLTVAQDCESALIVSLDFQKTVSAAISLLKEEEICRVAKPVRNMFKEF